MKALNVILFKDDNEIHKYSDTIFEEKLSRSSLSPEQEFCGIWGEIHFNNEECLKAISSSVNRFLQSENKIEIYFGCCEKDYNNIISRIDIQNCKVSKINCQDL